VGGALTDAVWLFAAFLVLLVAAAAVLASRRFLLERSGGTVECALRRLNVEGAPDHVGLASGTVGGVLACSPISVTSCSGTARWAC